MLIEKFQLKGEVNLFLYDKDGHLKEEVFIPNTVVSTGKTYVAALLAGTEHFIHNSMSYMAIGDDNSTVSVGDIRLYSELQREAVDSLIIDPLNENTVVFQATYPSNESQGSTYEIQEAGIFNVHLANHGTMLCRTTFSVINKEPLDSLVIIWRVMVV